MTAEQLIQSLNLKPHPEGGYYRETYRSPGTISGTGKAYSTAIYFLLEPGAVSKLHRLTSDEVFHFYLGEPVQWVLLHPGGQIEKIVLGPLLEQGQKVQMTVPAGTWFGGYLKTGAGFALMGTTVAPGFEFEDFRLGNPEELLVSFPGAKEEILRLT